MKIVRGGRSSPGLVVACLALCLAIGGGAVALSGGSGSPLREALSERQVTKLATNVASRRSRESVDRPRERALSTGLASNARNAANRRKVGSLEARRFSTTVASGGTAVTLFRLSGLVATVSCPAGVPTMVANNDSGVPARIRSRHIDQTTAVSSSGVDELAANSDLALLAPAGTDGAGNAEFNRNDDVNVSAWYGYRDDGSSCVYFGNAIGG